MKLKYIIILTLSILFIFHDRLNGQTQKELAKIARHDKDWNARKEAVEKLTDQEVIAKIAKYDEIWLVRKAAVEKLDSNEWKELLLDIANNDNEIKIIRIEAYYKIGEQSKIADFAKNDEDENVRKEAVLKLTDHSILTDIAINAQDENIRSEAVIKIIDQKLLAEVVKNGKFYYTNIEALEKIIDQEKLADIVKNANDINIRVKALENLDKEKWQNLLSQIAENNSEKTFIRTRAINNLNADIWQDLLSEIVKSIDRLEVRQAAVEKLTNQDLLSQIAKNENEPNTRILAINNLDPDIWQDLLSEIVENNDNEKIRQAAIKKLTTQDLLFDIAKNDEDEEIRIEAINTLSDQNLLADVAMYSEYYSTRRQAIKKVAPEILMKNRNKMPKGSVKGHLTEGEKPISNRLLFLCEKIDYYGKIYILYTNLKTYTDTNGFFILENVPVGIYTPVLFEKDVDISSLYELIDIDEYINKIKFGYIENTYNQLIKGSYSILSPHFKIWLTFLGVQYDEIFKFNIYAAKPTVFEFNIPMGEGVRYDIRAK